MSLLTLRQFSRQAPRAQNPTCSPGLYDRRRRHWPFRRLEMARGPPAHSGQRHRDTGCSTDLRAKPAPPHPSGPPRLQMVVPMHPDRFSILRSKDHIRIVGCHPVARLDKKWGSAEIARSGPTAFKVAVPHGYRRSSVEPYTGRSIPPEDRVSHFHLAIYRIHRCASEAVAVINDCTVGKAGPAASATDRSAVRIAGAVTYDETVADDRTAAITVDCRPGAAQPAHDGESLDEAVVILFAGQTNNGFRAGPLQNRVGPRLRLARVSAQQSYRPIQPWIDSRYVPGRTRLHTSSGALKSRAS